MINRIISVIDLVSAAKLTLQERYGLAEKVGSDIIVYNGDGQGTKINVDGNGSWSYWRLIGNIRQEQVDTLNGCAGVRFTIPLRHVISIPRDQDCEDISEKLISISMGIKLAHKTLRSALDAQMVRLSTATIEANSENSIRSELGNVQVPLQRSFAYMDINVQIDADESCLPICGDPWDPCDDCGSSGCTQDIKIYFNGVLKGTASSLDPCDTNTVNVTVN